MEPMIESAARFRSDSNTVLRVLELMPPLEKALAVEREEFEACSGRVFEALEAQDIDLVLVFSDEQYCGDVPHLAATPTSPWNRLPEWWDAAVSILLPDWKAAALPNS